MKGIYDLEKPEVGSEYYAFVLNPNGKGTGFIRKFEPFHIKLIDTKFDRYTHYKDNWEISNIKFREDKTYFASMNDCYFCDTLEEAKLAYNKVLKKEKNYMVRNKSAKISMSWLKERLAMTKPIPIEDDTA